MRGLNYASILGVLAALSSVVVTAAGEAGDALSLAVVAVAFAILAHVR